MAKITTNTLFKGVKLSKELLFMVTHTDDASGFCVTLKADTFEGRYTYRGPNDRTFVQKLQHTAKFKDAEASDIKDTAERLDPPTIQQESAIDFLRAWVYVEPMQSTDETRYMLGGICVDEGKMVATDGHRMAIYPNGFPKMVDGVLANRWVLPRAANAALARVLAFNLGQGVNTYTVGHHQGSLLFRSSSPALDVVLRITLPDGQFPDYPQVIPTFDLNESISLTGDVEKLAAALKTAPRTIPEGRGHSVLNLAIDHEGRVWACDKAGVPDPTPLPIEAKGWHNEERRLTVHFCLPYITDLFDGAGTFHARLSGDALSPLRWQQGDALGVVMPLRG